MSLKRTEKNRANDEFYDLGGPIAKIAGMAVIKPEKAPNREGFGFRGSALNQWIIAYAWCTQTERVFMNVIAELKNNYEEAQQLWKSYEVKLQEFRSAAKNDVASLEAHARKTTEAVQKMNRAYGDAISQLNSEGMAQAVQNAERLAAALGALSQLQSHKLVFAVTDQDQPTQD